MRYVFTVLFSLVLAVGLAGCDSNDNGGPGPTAQVRFMHASPGAGPVNVAVDGEVVAENVSYSSETTNPTVSNYLEVPTASGTTIEVQNAGGEALLSANVPDDVALQEDRQYTVIVAGVGSSPVPNVDTPQLIVLQDRFDETNLDDNQIGLRIVHGSALAGEVDVYQTNPGTSLSDATPLVEDFAFTEDFPGTFAGQFTPQTLSGNGSVISVLPAGSTDPADGLQLPVGTGSQGSLSVSAGQFITGVAVDAPGSNPPVGALIQIDTPSN
jgi:hypothetical protein